MCSTYYHKLFTTPYAVPINTNYLQHRVKEMLSQITYNPIDRTYYHKLFTALREENLQTNYLQLHEQ